MLLQCNAHATAAVAEACQRVRPKRLALGTANPLSHALLSGELCVTRTAMVHAWHLRGQVSFPFGDTGCGDAVREVTPASQ